MDINWPVLTLVAGWGLNELSHLLRNHSSNRAELCKATASLLEIRHALLVTERVIREMSERYKLPQSDFAAAMRPVVARQFISNDACETYAKAVSAIAANDPILAFDLAQRHRIPEFIAAINTMGSEEPQIAAFGKSMADTFSPHAIATLEKCILRLAWRASKRTWWECRSRFREGANVKLSDIPEFKPAWEYLDKLVAGTAAPSASATGVAITASN